MSAIAPPPPFQHNPLRRVLRNLGAERAAKSLPPGELRFSITRTRRFERDPLGLLLEGYERYGPIFTMRIFYATVVFMIGPQANHFITVSNARSFGWRDGVMGELIPFLGDGLLTIDGGYHKRTRRIMLPAFHHEHINAAVDVMIDEAERALEPWRDGEEVDAYAWTRQLALRVAMRALFGLDPDRATRGVNVAAEFERALHFWERDYFVQTLRGPFTPFARMQRARQQLDRVVFSEIARRRAGEEKGEDVLSLLIDARDEDGSGLTDQGVRDQVMTLLFAGHDTTTSTVSFLLHELARHPSALQHVLEEQEQVLDGRRPSAEELAGRLPQLEMAVDETLRLYPPAWLGPRRVVEPFEFGGHHVSREMLVFYSSWASHHLPDVFDSPEQFRPERFAPDERLKLPKGAYIPFGGGSRICIGRRFGHLEVKAIATALLQRFVPSPLPGYEIELRRMPTLSPRNGMPIRLRAREGGRLSLEATEEHSRLS
jgi:cytochrome P450